MLNALWQAKVGFQEAVLALLVMAAVLRGASPERWVAGVFAGMFVTDRLYHVLLPFGHLWRNINLGHFAIDSLAAVMFFIVALRANRTYPIWLAALQLAATISHVAIGLNQQLLKGAYAILMIAPSYLQFPVFAVGIWLHLRRSKQLGRYPSWLPF